MEEKVQLSDAEYFNVQSLPVLEASVANQVCKASPYVSCFPHIASSAMQVAKATYNARANRGVLKLYQLNPSKQDTNVVVQILAKVRTLLFMVVVVGDYPTATPIAEPHGAP
jgi:hypothetical protein